MNNSLAAPGPSLLGSQPILCGIRYDQIPEEVKRQAHLNILDTIACIASGARLEDSQRLLRAESARGGTLKPACWVCGRLPIGGDRVSAHGRCVS
jgi:hypothetical protein